MPLGVARRSLGFWVWNAEFWKRDSGVGGAYGTICLNLDPKHSYDFNNDWSGWLQRKYSRTQYCSRKQNDLSTGEQRLLTIEYAESTCAELPHTAPDRGRWAAGLLWLGAAGAGVGVAVFLPLRLGCQRLPFSPSALPGIRQRTSEFFAGVLTPVYDSRAGRGEAASSLAGDGDVRPRVLLRMADPALGGDAVRDPGRAQDSSLCGSGDCVFSWTADQRCNCFGEPGVHSVWPDAGRRGVGLEARTLELVLRGGAGGGLCQSASADDAGDPIAVREASMDADHDDGSSRAGALCIAVQGLAAGLPRVHEFAKGHVADEARLWMRAGGQSGTRPAEPGRALRESMHLVLRGLRRGDVPDFALALPAVSRAQSLLCELGAGDAARRGFAESADS